MKIQNQPQKIRSFGAATTHIHTHTHKIVQMPNLLIEKQRNKPNASHYFKCHLPRYIWAVMADKTMEKGKQPKAFFIHTKTSLI